jgi:eukaryotic-like serine/threonine-protein kinase
MFMGEAKMVGKLQHPNIVPIFDAGEENGRRYVVTEHVHGARTLSAYCRPGSLLPIDQVVAIMYKCAKALHYAHSRGVVHRDIKPSNILLTQEGDVRIVDFGIALVADSDVSRLEGVAGSPAYMSPEQVQGLELDARSDIYSLGAVMYEMLCGQRPFRAGALGKLLRQVVQASPNPCASGRDSGRTRGSRQAATAEGTRQPVSHGQPSCGGADARAPEAACVAGRDRRRRTLRGDAQAALLPRFLARRDPRGDARRRVDGMPAGETLLRPGDIDDRFYIVVSGTVRLSRGGDIVGSRAGGRLLR